MCIINTIILCCFSQILLASWCENLNTNKMFKVQGKVIVPNTTVAEWLTDTRILVDGGQYLGFLRNDGTFTVTNVPSGSYIVEVANPVYEFESVRVDIKINGKTYAKRLDLINPSAQVPITYPLKFKAKGRINYFEERDQWRLTDMLKSPILLIPPMMLMIVMPKLMKRYSPEKYKEMEEAWKLMYLSRDFDISDALTNLSPGRKDQPKRRTNNKPTRARRRKKNFR